MNQRLQWSLGDMLSPVVKPLVAFFSLMRFVGFRHLIVAWKRSLLTIFGIALGVMCFVAITLSNEMILHSVYAMKRNMMGKADFVISAPTGGMAESIVNTVRQVDGVAHAMPILERTLFMPEYNTTMLMMGVDLLSDPYFFVDQVPKDMDVSSMGDPLLLIGTTDSLVLPKSFADRYQIKQGDTITVPTPDGQSDFNVIGLLDPGDSSAGMMARAFGGQMLLLDLVAAQIRMGAQDKVDRIFVAVDQGADPIPIQNQLQEKLGPDITVGLPGEMAKDAMKTLARFAIATQMMSMLALVLGVILVYNVMTISMISRRQETGILRLVGTSRTLLLSTVVGEAVILGIVGSIVGILAGWGFSGGTMDIMAQTVSTGYMPVNVDNQNFYPLLISAATMGLIMGVNTAIFGSVVPAWRASNLSPLDIMTGNVGSSLFAPHNFRRTLTALVPLAGIGIITMVPKYQGSQNLSNLPLTLFSITLILLIVVLITPGFITLLLKLLARPLQGAFGILGRIAGDNLYNGLERSWINVTNLSIGVSMVVCIICFMHTTRISVMEFVEQVFAADFLVSGDASLGMETRRPLNETTIDTFAEIPGIVSSYGFRRLTSTNRGASMDIVGFDDANNPSGMMNLTVLKGVLPQYKKMKEEPIVVINELLAEQKQLKPGSTLSLPTPNGRKDFQVTAIVSDFLAGRTIAYVSRDWIRKLWDDHLVDGIFLSLEKGKDPELVRKEIYHRVGKGNQVFVYSNQDIRKEVNKILNKMFNLVTVMEILALVVAILGIFNTIWAEVIDRAKEISMLRIIGMLSQQLRKCFIIESSIMGLGAAVLGIISGLVMAYFLIYQLVPIIIGWTLPYRVDWPGVTVASGAIFLVTITTGLIASYQATRGRAIEI